MKHLIKKQFIELALGNTLDHFHLQQLVSQHYWDTIVPALEKEFDKISNEDEVIEIDRLEIDLGIFSEKNFEKNEWTVGLPAKLGEILRKAVDVGSFNKAVKTTSKRLSVFSQWLSYMRKGYLPWNTGQIDEQWYQLVLETLAVDFEMVQLLRDEIRADFSILKRIIAQHDETFLVRLTEILTSEKQDDLPETINELVILSIFLQKRSQPQQIIREREIKNSLWIQLIRLAARKIETATKMKLSRQMVLLFAMENEIEKKLPASISSQVKIVLPLLKSAESGEIEIAKQKISDIEDEIINQKQKETVDEEGIFVANAGVVLLHPFLAKLFDRLNLVSEGSFRDLHAHQTTLHILHYIATGKTGPEEHELVIAKILCSYPLSEPVERDMEIATDVLNESDEMIKAVIQQWDILKNTSPSGLREGFLQRNGKLFSKNGNLYLQVEKNAIDVLLDYLPWNLSIIILPWMKDILRVEWR